MTQASVWQQNSSGSLRVGRADINRFRVQCDGNRIVLAWNASFRSVLNFLYQLQRWFIIDRYSVENIIVKSTNAIIRREHPDVLVSGATERLLRRKNVLDSRRSSCWVPPQKPINSLPSLTNTSLRHPSWLLLQSTAFDCSNMLINDSLVCL